MLRSDCAFAQADLGLRCPLTESVDTVDTVDERWMPISDCADAHADLDLRCPQIAWRPFPCTAHHMSRGTSLPTRLHALLAKTQISLSIHTADQSSLSAYKGLRSLAAYSVPCEEFYQTVRMRRLIGVLAEHACHLVGNTAARFISTLWRRYSIPFATFAGRNYIRINCILPN